MLYFLLYFQLILLVYPFSGYLVTSPSGQKATFIHLLTEDGAALLTKSVSGKRIAHDSAGLPLKLPFSVSIYPSTKYFKRTFKRFLADTYEQ